MNLRMVCAVVPLLACGAQPVSVKVGESEPGTARFTVQNRSGRDIQRIRFEMTYRSRDGTVVRVDTTGYTLTLDHTGAAVPFVRAGEEAFLVRELPAGGESAQARVLKVAFMDGGTWPDAR